MSGPTCTACGRTKKPIGRDVGAAMGGDVCSWDCDGYLLEPKPPMDWPDRGTVLGIPIVTDPLMPEGTAAFVRDDGTVAGVITGVKP